MIISNKRIHNGNPMSKNAQPDWPLISLALWLHRLS